MTLLVRPGQWHRTRTFDASLHVLASLDHEVSRRGAFVAYIGSGEHAVRLRILGSGTLAPGDDGFARLHLSNALPLTPGDRYVLRESGRSETVGGGEMLDVDPVVRAGRARPDRSVDRVVAERGWVTVDELERLTGEHREPTAGRWVVDPDALERSRESVDRSHRGRGSARPRHRHARRARPCRARRARARMAMSSVAGGRAVRAGSADPLAGHPYVAALEAAPVPSAVGGRVRRRPRRAARARPPRARRRTRRRVVRARGRRRRGAGSGDDARRHARWRCGRRRASASGHNTEVGGPAAHDSRQSGHHSPPRRCPDRRTTPSRRRVDPPTRPGARYTGSACGQLPCSRGRGGRGAACARSRSAHPRCHVAP